MRRVIDPLSKMGAQILSHDGNCPLQISGQPLHGIDFTLPVASAQLKSAILLASLYADSPTTIHEPVASRDHTERMLLYMGANLTTEPGLALCTQKPSFPCIDDHSR